MTKRASIESTAEAYLELLAARGVEYFFGNAGTDFAPIIEAYAYLEPSPDYEVICQASGGHGERVEDPAALPEALARALRLVREEKRQARVNVVCRKP